MKFKKFLSFDVPMIPSGVLVENGVISQKDVQFFGQIFSLTTV